MKEKFRRFFNRIKNLNDYLDGIIGILAKIKALWIFLAPIIKPLFKVFILLYLGW